jgi:predicted  nucleic acid-binding Zn-ribbon protein
VKTTLINLLKLAEIDSKIDQLIEKQKEIPQLLLQLETEMSTLNHQNTNKAKEVKDLETSKTQIQSFLLEKKAWVEEREGKSKELKTNKEYQASLKEVSFAKKEIFDKENALNGILQKVEEAQKASQEISELMGSRLEEINSKIAESKSQLERLESLIDSERQNRGAILSEVSEKVLHHYEHIMRRTFPAVSKIEKGVCTECGTRVAPQMLNQIHVAQEIQYCSRCKRILYLEELLM